jgi:hypothetical protein
MSFRFVPKVAAFAICILWVGRAAARTGDQIDRNGAREPQESERAARTGQDGPAQENQPQAERPPVAVIVITFVSLGLVMIATAIPLVKRRVKPNGLYGFRTPKTLRNERIWYEANAYSGRLLLWLGIVVTVTSILLHFLLGAAPIIHDPDQRLLVYTVACLVLVAGGVLLVAFLSLRYLRTL